MAFNVFINHTQGAYFTILIISAVISTIAVALRFVATKLTRRKPALEDWLALAAVAVFLARTGIVLHCLTIINGRGLELAFDQDAFQEAFKLIYVAEMLTSLEQTLAKFSIMALYYRIFGVNRAYVRWIWVLAAFQTATCAAMVFVQMFQCNPVRSLWQWWTPGSCINNTTILVAVEPPNSLLDFALVILAMFMIRYLQIAAGTKWKLRFIFGLGLSRNLRVCEDGDSLFPDRAFSAVALGLWAAVQSLATIVCCCAPVYKPLLPEIGIWSHLTSKVSSLSLRPRQTSKTAASGSVSSPVTGNRGPSTETGSQRSQKWLHLGKSSSTGLAWAEHNTENGNQDQVCDTQLLGSIQVKKDIHVV